MGCEPWRDLLSAQLDNEDEPGDRARTEDHLAGCADCRQWLDRAAMVNRLTRTAVAAPVSDLSAAIVAALPVAPPPAAGVPAAARPGRRSLAGALFSLLGAVGGVQLVLGLAQAGSGTDQHAHAGGLATNAGHLWHESAAWNVAVGTGFLVLGLRRTRPTGLVPMLSAFVAMLLLLSVDDLTASRVDVPRLVSHGFVLVGYVLVVALSRLAPQGSRPPGGRGQAGARWRARFDEAAAPGRPAAPLRLVRRRSTGPLTAGPLTAGRLTAGPGTAAAVTAWQDGRRAA